MTTRLIWWIQQSINFCVISITSMQQRIQEMTALPSRSQYPLKIKIQQVPSEAMQIWSANISVQIKPAFQSQTREIGQILALKSQCRNISRISNQFRKIEFWFIPPKQPFGMVISENDIKKSPSALHLDNFRKVRKFTKKCNFYSWN